MASISKRGEKWCVRWDEPEVLIDEHGTRKTRWKSRRRTCPTLAAAKVLKREIEETASKGDRWEDARKKEVATIRAIALGWVSATAQSGAPMTTVRNRASLLGSFLKFLNADQPDAQGARRRVDELSLPLLRAYADSLPGEGRKASTRHRKVLVVEQMWRWAWEMREDYPGVPEPRKLTGTARTADRLRPPPPVVAMAAPTWAEADRMLGSLNALWHKRAGLLMRCFGLRASQVCGLKWADLNLDRGTLYVRSNVRGSKASRARVVPLPKWLVAEMKGWAREEKRAGLLFPRRYLNPQTGVPYDGPYRGDALLEPYRRAWKAAGVAEDRWGKPPGSGRGKASPTHAMRRMLRTELVRAGHQEALVLYFTGQSQGVTAAAYVPETSPEQSPYWPLLVAMADGIPQPAFLPLRA